MCVVQTGLSNWPKHISIIDLFMCVVQTGLSNWPKHISIIDLFMCVCFDAAQMLYKNGRSGAAVTSRGDY